MENIKIMLTQDLAQQNIVCSQKPVWNGLEHILDKSQQFL